MVYSVQIVQIIQGPFPCIIWIIWTLYTIGLLTVEFIGCFAYTLIGKTSNILNTFLGKAASSGAKWMQSLKFSGNRENTLKKDIRQVDVAGALPVVKPGYVKKPNFSHHRGVT